MQLRCSSAAHPAPAKACLWQGVTHPGESSTLLWKQSSGKTTRGKRERKTEQERGLSICISYLSPSHLKGFGFLSNCQQGNKAMRGSQG